MNFSADSEFKVKKELALEHLRTHGIPFGHISEFARELGINSNTMHNIVRKYRIDNGIVNPPTTNTAYIEGVMKDADRIVETYVNNGRSRIHTVKLLGINEYKVSLALFIKGMDEAVPPSFLKQFLKRYAKHRGTAVPGQLSASEGQVPRVGATKAHDTSCSIDVDQEQIIQAIKGIISQRDALLIQKEEFSEKLKTGYEYSDGMMKKFQQVIKELQDENNKLKEQISKYQATVLNQEKAISSLRAERINFKWNIQEPHNVVERN